MKNILEIRNLTKMIDNKVILKKISFFIKKGEIIAIIGPSGSGKTTLLRCIQGITNFDKGKIIFSKNSSHDLQEKKPKIGMVFQKYNLWPHKNVLENVNLALRIVAKLEKNIADERAKKYLELLHIEDKINYYPKSLSGGEQQRVAIARCLSLEPDILLFDEVTSSLDIKLIYELTLIMKSLVKKKNNSILLVTHDLNFARQVANRVIFIDGGKIVFMEEAEEMFSKTSDVSIKYYLKYFEYKI